jgi:hypothetical protein
MKYALLIIMILLVGCVGSPNPHTVMGEPGTECSPSEVRGEKLWWQHTTVGVSKADNPWEKFNQPKARVDPFDPWATYEQPKLFTDEFIKREKAKRAKSDAIRKRLRKMLEKAFYPKEI